MDSNFHITPRVNSKNYLKQDAGQQASYMGAKDSGLQKDTVSFTGKHIQHDGNGNSGWKKGLLVVLGLLGVGANLAGCQGQADEEIVAPTDQVTPEQPNTDNLDVPEDYRAVIPEITEGYTSVQHLYLNDDVKFNSITFAPSNLPKGVIQTIVSPEKDDENNTLIGSTLRILIEKATPIDAICEANGIEDTAGAWHNAIHEYLQSNPDLAAHIAKLNNVNSVEELTDDIIADTVLHPEANKPLTLLGVVAPTFSMPVPGFGSENTVDTVLVQTQYSPKFTEDGYVTIDSKTDGKTDGTYTGVTAAIVKEYDVPEGTKDPNFMYIAHQIANAPENKEIIETYIQNLNIATAVDDVTSPEDNKRTQALLAMTDVESLYLPDNILVNAIQHSTGDVEYNYTNGTKVYELAARTPVDGEGVHFVTLEETIDPEADPTPNGIQKLQDVLKYYFDPRTGAPLAEIAEDKDGKVVVQSNVVDQLGKDLETAYMSNVIKDNLGIFAATQTIGEDAYMFGAYDILDEDVIEFIDTKLAEAREDDTMTDDEILTSVRDAAVQEFADGKLENFLEKYAGLNLNRAMQIELYDAEGNIRFVNENGSAIKFNLPDAYVTFGKAGEVKNNTVSSTPSRTVSTTPSRTVSTTPSRTVSTTPSKTISTTPSKTVSTTPSKTISTTPSKTVSSTPSKTVSSTPSKTVSSTPSKTVSSTPSKTVSSTPSKTVSSTPSKTVSSTPSKTVSSTPSKTVSTTPSKTVSTTPSKTISTTPSKTVSTTPSKTVSTTPSFGPDKPITEPGDSKTPSSTVSKTPSSTPSSSVSSTPSNTSSYCPPPPPSSDSTTPVDGNKVTGSSASRTQTQSSTVSTPSSTGGSSSTSSTTGGSPGVTSVGQGDSSTPAPSSSSTGGSTTGSTTGGSSSTSSTPASVSSTPADKTNEAIKSDGDTDERGAARAAESQAVTSKVTEVQSETKAVEAQPETVAAEPQVAAAPAETRVETVEVQPETKTVEVQPAEVKVETKDTTAEAIKSYEDTDVRGAVSAPAAHVEDNGEIVIEE